MPSLCVTFSRFVIVTFAAFLMVLPAGAEVPQVIPYQGRLLDSGGNPVGDGPQLVQFVIYDAAVGGVDLWTSGFHSVMVSDGLFSTLLGAAPHPALPDNLFGGDFFAADTSRWLGITVGVDPEIAPRTRFTSAAYAYQALRADTAEAAWDVIGQAIGTDNLSNEAVTVQKLAPGVATSVGQITRNIGGSFVSTAPTTIAAFTATAPSAGKLVVIASGQFYMNIDATTTAAIASSVNLGLCELPNDASSPATTPTRVRTFRMLITAILPMKPSTSASREFLIFPPPVSIHTF